jgi:hypothetical protein
MTNRPVEGRRRENITLAWLTATVFLAAAVVSKSHPADFRSYFGAIQPLLALTVVTVPGVIALLYLRARGWFDVLRGADTARGIARAVVPVSLFFVVVVTVDAVVGFPRDINVPWPRALLFYPVMAFVVEMVFHLVPLAVLLAIARPLLDRFGRDRLLWSVIVVVALIEPVFHVVMGSGGGAPSGLDLFVGVHVFLFTLVELNFFRRYDFVTMYAYRIVYYLLWHIVWGALRLEWLI